VADEPDPLVQALRTLTGSSSAQFRPGQREAIVALVEHRQRVLVVQRTGWGKSAVYFVSTHLLRQSGFGATLLLSPLLALMRNQIEAARRLGIRAASITSENPDEFNAIVDALERDEVDLLLVSPERLANLRFLDAWLPIVAERPGLIVVDEVHCISDWGHDFRPDYRRIGGVLNQLPSTIPVLGCTATANDRVVVDVQHQLGRALATYRGTLGRESLSLHVLNLPSAADRLAWLVETVPTLPGSGIVYCLTKHDVDMVSEFLREHGVSARGYHSDHDPADRVEVENALLANDVKAVVATSALGMGFDKPDLGFVVHYQSPGSPISYYQQVGRAGRALPDSVGVLLCGDEDADIQDFFIRTAFAPEPVVAAVVAAFDRADGPLSLQALEALVNIGRGKLQVLLKQLEVDGALERASTQSWSRTLQPWHYPRERIDAITAMRRAEQGEMDRYAATVGCRMEFLTRLLDDPTPTVCGRCDGCVGAAYRPPQSADIVRSARIFDRRRPIWIEPKKLWPSGLGDVRGRIHADHQPQRGRALTRWGHGPTAQLVKSGKRRDGHFDDGLVDELADLVRRWAPLPAPEWVTSVPSQRHPELVPELGRRLADRLGLPWLAVVRQVRPNQEQKQMENSAHRVRNLLGAFEAGGGVPSGPVLLLDDIVDSGWTLAVVSRLLLLAGSGPVHTVALSRAGSDA
jgi:ATP-dependent DNA helicase RecQ